MEFDAHAPVHHQKQSSMLESATTPSQQLAISLCLRCSMLLFPLVDALCFVLCALCFVLYALCLSMRLPTGDHLPHNPMVYSSCHVIPTNRRSDYCSCACSLIPFLCLFLDWVRVDQLHQMAMLIAHSPPSSSTTSHSHCQLRGII